MVATQLRDRGIEIPLIAITALKLEGIRRKALDVGYSDFLEKPLEQEEISRILHRYLFPESV
jgi:CheY-like chemotaxis protein